MPDIRDIRRILSALRQNNTVRLSNLSGVTFYLRNNGLNTNLEPLPFEFPSLDIRLQTLFRTAKYLESQGILKVVYKNGENYLIKPDNSKPLNNSPLFFF